MQKPRSGIRINRNNHNSGVANCLAARKDRTFQTGNILPAGCGMIFVFLIDNRKTVDLLTINNEIGILGSSCELIDEHGYTLGEQKVPESDLEVRWFSLVQSPFIDSTVMLRRSLFTSYNLNYDPYTTVLKIMIYGHALLLVTKSANLGNSLLKYRVIRRV